MGVSPQFADIINHDFQPGPFEVLWEATIDGHDVVWIKIFWDEEHIGLLFCETCMISDEGNGADCPCMYGACGLRRAQLRREMQTKYWREHELDARGAIGELIERARNFEFLGSHDEYHMDVHDVFDILRHAGCEGYREASFEELLEIMAELQPELNAGQAQQIYIGGLNRTLPV